MKLLLILALLGEIGYRQPPSNISDVTEGVSIVGDVNVGDDGAIIDVDGTGGSVQVTGENGFVLAPELQLNDTALSGSGSVELSDGTYTFLDSTDAVAALNGNLPIGNVTGLGTDVSLMLQDPVNEAGGPVSSTDPGADRILFWDESNDAVGHLTPDGDFSISGTTMSVAGLAITSGQTLTVTTGGTLGSAAYTSSGAYQPLTSTLTSWGLITRGTGFDTAAAIAPNAMGGAITAGGTVLGGTVTSSTPLINWTQTWNSGATTFRGVDITITDTASASGSTSFRIRGGASGTTNLLLLDKDGAMTINNGLTAIGNVYAQNGGNNTAGLVRTDGTRPLIFAWNNGLLCFSSAAGWDGTTGDFQIGREAAATMQLGIDGATAIAQTIKAMDDNSGDGAGANLILAGGRNLGASTEGKVLIQVAATASTGVAGTLGTMATFDRTGMSLAATTGVGVTFLNGAAWQISDNGSSTLQIVAGSGAGTQGLGIAAGEVRLPAAAALGWTTNTSVAVALETFATREAARVIQLGADAATALDYTIKGNDDSTGDGAGGNLTLAGGRNLGASTEGKVIIQIPATASTGVAGTLATQATFSRQGLALTKIHDTVGGDRTINAQCGSFYIMSGDDSVTITNNYMTADSVVLVTADTNTGDFLQFIVRKTATTFVIELEATVSDDTKYNFLIVN
jgi:hypothetical protein